MNDTEFDRTDSMTQENAILPEADNEPADNTVSNEMTEPSITPVPEPKVSTIRPSASGRVIRTEGLVRRYGKRTVVNGVSITVRQGEVVGLLGPNGAGKTTTFYMITGMIRSTRGKIFLDEKNISGKPMYKRARMGIGYLAQEASVFRKLTVAENVLAALETQKMGARQRKERMRELLSELNIGHLETSLGFTLSGGERRRVEIARCLAINPDFILLDEPFAGVDPIAVEDIQSIVYDLKMRGYGVLITDHNVRETLRITDRAYIIAEGRILLDGTAQELADNPEARKVYLGQNFKLD